MSEQEFAQVLAQVLAWTPTAEGVESWESTSTPPGDVILAAGMLSNETPNLGGGPRDQHADLISQFTADRFADVRAIYLSRAEFATAMPPDSLLSGATDIAIAGLSLNILCQQYADHRVRKMVENGTTIRACTWSLMVRR